MNIKDYYLNGVFGVDLQPRPYELQPQPRPYEDISS